jgi:hypothetical protein
MARPQRRAMKDRNSAAVAAATRVWYRVEMATQTGPVVVQAVVASLTRMAATVALPEQLAAIPVLRPAPMAVGKEANSAAMMAQPAWSAAIPVTRALLMAVGMEGSPAGISAPTAVGKAARAVPPVGREANPAARAILPAPSAATLGMMVEMEVPTSLLDQFLNLWETLEKLGELCSRNYCKMSHHWACDCHSNDRTYQYSSLSPRHRAFFKRLLPRRVPF